MARVSEKAEKNYAEVLFELVSQDAQDSYVVVMESWLKIMQDVPEMRELLENPAFSLNDKESLVNDILNELAPNDNVLSNFFMELVANKRLRELDKILERYKALLRQARQIIALEVISAFEIDCLEKDNLKNSIEDVLENRVEINWQVDDQIIGGLIIKAGDTVIDNSLSGALNRIRRELMI